MASCLGCSSEMVKEYDSQICMYCAGELPRPAHHSRVRDFLVRLKLLHGHENKPGADGPGGALPQGMRHVQQTPLRKV
jgi:hypothetical protein